MSPLSAYLCVLSASPVHQSFYMGLSLAKAVLCAAWTAHQDLQADACGRRISFWATLGFPYLLCQTSLGVIWSTGQQLQPWFAVAWSSSASTVPQVSAAVTQRKSFLQHDLKIAFYPWVTRFVHLQFLRLGTFPLGRRLEGKGDFAVYQPMISVAVCTGHHSGK